MPVNLRYTTTTPFDPHPIDPRSVALQIRPLFNPQRLSYLITSTICPSIITFRPLLRYPSLLEETIGRPGRGDWREHVYGERETSSCTTLDTKRIIGETCIIIYVCVYFVILRRGVMSIVLLSGMSPSLSSSLYCFVSGLSFCPFVCVFCGFYLERVVPGRTWEMGDEIGEKWLSAQEDCVFCVYG